MSLVEKVADLDFSQHSRHIPELVELALELGYTVQQNEKKFIGLRSPVQDKTIQLPPTGRQMNSTKEIHLFRVVLRYGDTDRIQDLSERINHLPDSVQHAFTARRSERPVADLTHTIGEAVEAVQKTKEVHVEESTTHVVSEEPTSPGSPIFKRQWSNGGIDFRCGLKGCAYTGTTVAKVSGHIGHAKIHRDYVEAAKAQRIKAAELRQNATAATYVAEGPKEVTGYTPAGPVIALPYEPITADIARVPGAEVPPDMSAEETLDAIRRLVSPREREQIAALGATINRLTAELEAMTKRAKEAEDRWEALRGLINQE